MRRTLCLLPVAISCALMAACASAGRATSGARDRPDPLSRIEILSRILVLEDSRSLGGGAVQGFLLHEDSAIRRRAAIAAGRIGDPLVGASLIPRLRDPEVEVRRAAAFALGLIGAPEAATALITALSDEDPLMRGRASEALSRIGLPSAGKAIADAFRRAVPPNAARILRVRGDDPGRVDDPWIELRLHLLALARLKDADSLVGVALGADGSPILDWWACVWSSVQVADGRLAPIFIAGAEAEDPYIRSLSAEGLGALKNPSHLGLVRRLAGDREPAVVLQALRAAAAIGTAESASIAAIQIDSPTPAVRREALLTLAPLPSISRWRSSVMASVGHPDPWIRSAAWPALIAIDAADIGIVLSTIGPDADWRVRQAVAIALAENLGERAAPLLLPMLKDSDPRVVSSVLSAITLARDLDAVPTLLDYIQHPDQGVRSAAVGGLSRVEEKNDRPFTNAFLQAYEASASDEEIETRLAAVVASAKRVSADGRAMLRKVSGSDPVRAVRQRALSALGQGFAQADETALRLADARRIVSVYAQESERLYSPRVLISTRHGIIELALDLVDAPLTTGSFVRLAQGGFFNGLTFHRLVPGLVLGGDPRGDGYGGPGTALRSEYSLRPYGRGSVGMVTSERDAGGSQFFIATAPQPLMDGVCTLFGQVISGMSVVEKIQPGDAMIRVEVFDGRDLR